MPRKTKEFGSEVTATSSSPEKMEQALEFGADHFINSTQFVSSIDESDSSRLFDYDFDLLICTGNHGINRSPLLMKLKKWGGLVLLGFPDLELNSTNLVAHELSVTGSLVGNPTIMRKMARLAR